MDEHIDPLALMAFAQVASAGSFSAAARSSGRSRQSVHRQIGELEASLGVRLFERSTRSLRITDIGQRLLVHANRVRADMLAATEEMKSARAEPSGTLRVTAPALLGEEFVSPVVADVLERYPDVRIEEVLALDRFDLIADRFDLAVRPGELADSGLLARFLGRAAVVCCAAPGYLESAPPVRTPDDIAAVATLHYGRDRPGMDVEWPLGDNPVRHRPRLTSTSARTVCAAAVRGMGVARLPLLACTAHIAAGTLVEVLAPWRNEAAPIHAVYASHSATNPTLKVFVEALLDAASRASWLTR